jgi:hypothetical protein
MIHEYSYLIEFGSHQDRESSWHKCKICGCVFDHNHGEDAAIEHVKLHQEFINFRLLKDIFGRLDQMEKDLSNIKRAHNAP